MKLRIHHFVKDSQIPFIQQIDFDHVTEVWFSDQTDDYNGIWLIIKFEPGKTDYLLDQTAVEFDIHDDTFTVYDH